MPDTNSSEPFKSQPDAPPPGDSLLMPDAAREYQLFLTALKARIQAAQIKATLAVNRELVLLYWSIGRDILARQQQQGWGAKVIERLAKDLRNAFPDIKGFSQRNLVYMQTLAAAYPDEEFAQQVVAQIPWGHNVVILDKVHDSREREWYMRASVEYGWSRSVLLHQLDSRLYHRQGKAITNFEQTLPNPQSDLAQQMLKDPYIFDFTGLSRETEERRLERSLIQHVRDFLLELGVGFSFVGSQYHLEVEGEDFFLDLLFYHLKLRCFIVVELKTTDFKPEYAGKMQFYVSAVDALLKHENDAPTIGLILCQTRKRLIVEYTLRGTSLPMGVSEYHLAAALPDALKSSLPTIEELEAELSQRAVTEENLEE